MQMKMGKKPTQHFDNKKIRQILETEDEFISNLLGCFEVPTSVEDEEFEDQYLLKTSKKAKNTKIQPRKLNQQTNGANSSIDLQQRLETIQNKMKSKKAKPSARAIEKKKQKKLKKSKELKKQVISIAKSIKNEKVKEGKAGAKISNGNADEDVKPDIKPDIKLDVKPAKVFNEEGKLVFSKFEFAAQVSQAKKSKKDKTVKNPKILLKKIKEEKAQLNELVAQGEIEKAEEIKQNIAWQKAFDKTDGKKVKDSAALLHKSIHRKKVEKKKSKVQWKEREQKVQHEMKSKAKKREENIQKKKDEKKKHKMKHAAKRGRVVAGF